MSAPTLPPDLPRPARRPDLFRAFDHLSIDHETRDHPAIFTVEQGRDLKKTMPGGHSKNLFLKDKAGTLTLITALPDTTIDLKFLGTELGAKARLSFGKPDLMEEILGVTPGAVTPVALINDRPAQITHVLVDPAIDGEDRVWFHPLENTASTAIRPADLHRFIEACGHRPLTRPLAPL